MTPRCPKPSPAHYHQLRWQPHWDRGSGVALGRQENWSNQNRAVSQRLWQLKTQSKIRVRWKVRTGIPSQGRQMGKGMTVSTWFGFNCCEAEGWKSGFPAVQFRPCSFISFLIFPIMVPEEGWEALSNHCCFWPFLLSSLSSITAPSPNPSPNGSTPTARGKAGSEVLAFPSLPAHHRRRRYARYPGV